jgi:hypothetical protein
MPHSAVVTTHFFPVFCGQVEQLIVIQNSIVVLVGKVEFYETSIIHCKKKLLDWPLWNVPMDGSTAAPGALQPLSNGNRTSLQCQSEVYGDISPCSMECKNFSNSNLTSSLDAFITNDFTDFNCTLVIRSSNLTGNSSYVIQIPRSNNLIYFSNSFANDTQFLCESDNSSTSYTPMICRFIYRQQSFNNTPCPSVAVTTRYIAPSTKLLCLL